MDPEQLAVEHRETGPLDPYLLREQFPLLHRRVHGKPLAYLDNAASTQKPRAVIQLVESYYRNHYSNVHRGIHQLSAEATEAYEESRDRVAGLLGATDRREVVFTSGTTGSINLVAHAFGGRFIHEGDEIVLTQMEHHSNIVPWQLLAERTGARLRFVPINDAGELELDAYYDLLGPRTRLVGVVHTSNALGTRNPLRPMIEAAHQTGIPVLVDGAQAMAHQRIDVAELDCDFFAFSGHKMFAPTGIGVLYGKYERLESMTPFQGGGEMIQSVTLEGSTYKNPPYRFEAGTPDIAGAIGLGAASAFLDAVGMDRIAAHDDELLEYATRRLEEIPRIRLVGTAASKSSIVSFVVDGIHPHDVGTVIDMEGVAVRAGHHCAQPVMDRLGVPATVRASVACYNTREDVDALVSGVHKAIEVLG